MKKLIFCCLLAVFALSGTVKAQMPDFQPLCAELGTDSLIVTIANYSGSYQGSLKVGFFDNNNTAFVGSVILKNISLPGGTTQEYVKYLPFPLPLQVRLVVDYLNLVCESDESNNGILFYPDPPNNPLFFSYYAHGAGNNLLDKDSIDLLPGEFFSAQFGISEVLGQAVIMAHYNYLSFPVSTSDLTVEWQPLGGGISGQLYNGNYFSFSSPGVSNYAWLSNSPTNLPYFFWLGRYSIVNCNLPVGESYTVNLTSEIYTPQSLQAPSYIGWQKYIRTVDRLRGDLDDDADVDYDDLSLAMQVVLGQLYNPSTSYENMYQELGLNYGAAIILFSVPDPASNALLNIWLNNPNDPLVNGLGIGELMSAVNPCNGGFVEKIANSASLNNQQLLINAPGANMYNATGIKDDGSLWQSTGVINGSLSLNIPTNLLSYRVETIYVPANVISGLSDVLVTDELNIGPNPFNSYLNIEGSGEVLIYDLLGRVVYSSALAGQAQINTEHWSAGPYILQQLSSNDCLTVKKLFKQ